MMGHRRWVVRHLSNGLAPCIGLLLVAATNAVIGGPGLLTGERGGRGPAVVALLTLPVTILVGELFVAHRYWELGMPAPDAVDLAAAHRAKVHAEEQARLARTRQRSLRSASGPASAKA